MKAGARWWMVNCTACPWGNDRRGTEEEVTKYGCGKCGAPVTAAAVSAPAGVGAGQMEGS